MISLLAKNDPLEVKRIKDECTYTEIASCYKSKMAHTQGVGWELKE